MPRPDVRPARSVPLVRAKSEHAAPPSLRSALRSGAACRRWCRYWLRDPAVGLAEHAFFHLFRALPLDLVSRIGARLGRYRGAELARLSQRAGTALGDLAPSLSEPARAQLLERLRANSGRAFLEALNADRVCSEARVLLADPVTLSRVVASGRPLIFVSVHTANLGDLLGAILLRRVRHRAATTTRPFANRYRERLAVRMRAGMDVQILHPSISAARQLLRHLRAPRQSILLHLDEARGQQIHFPVFGGPLPHGGNLTLALRLARLSGALLVPVHLRRRLEGAHFMLHLGTPMDLSDPGATLTDDEAARQLDEYFSAVVRRHLDDWQQLYFLRR